MAGTNQGAVKTKLKIKEKFGDDFYKRIGQNSHTGGFASNKIGEDGLTGSQRAKIAGRKGGLKSRRGKAKK